MIENAGAYRNSPHVAVRAVAVIVALIVCAGIFDLIHRYIASWLGYGLTLSGNHIATGFIFWLTYLPLLPVPFFVARRYRLDLERRSTSVLVHLACGTLFSYAQTFLASAVAVALGLRAAGMSMPQGIFAAFVWNVVNNFPIPFLSYWAVVISMCAFYYEDEARQRLLASARLQSSLTETRLRALQAQLSPHFFFNTLNAISALAVTGNRNAVVEMLARLGDFLRVCLDDGRPQQIPLSKEIEFADSYLAIQKLWFGDRMTVRRNIAPDVLEALVPCMLLQPVIENAVVHGIAARSEHGCITISAERENGTLRLQVTDTGPGFDAEPEQREGLGMAITRGRLEQMYGTRHQIRYGGGPGTGAQVSITIPFARQSETGVVV
jgi:two-component system LytT family sensor kinase